MLATQRQELKDNPSERIKVIQKRLEDIFQLFNLWTQYVEIIYMPESEISMLE